MLVGIDHAQGLLFALLQVKRGWAAWGSLFPSKEAAFTVSFPTSCAKVQHFTPHIHTCH